MLRIEKLKGTKKDDLFKDQLVYTPAPQLWLGYTVAMEHQMGLQTSENTLGQLNWDPTGISLTLTTAQAV